MKGIENRPEVWAIGGGKGGTGKSLISCSMGIDLSKKGKNTIIIDGDLGGSNIHSFFGRDKVRASLTDFFYKKKELPELISDSGFENLHFIAGDMDSVNPAGIPYFSRAKFYRKIRELNADIIIIDLGAGSVLNTIDTFLISDRKIVVSTPEITSIENLYLFIKKVLIRRLSELYLKRGYGKLVRNFWQNKDPEVKVNTFTEFLDYLGKSDVGLSEDIDSEYSNINMNIVLNQVRDDDQIGTGISLNSIIKNHFRIKSKFAGFLRFDRGFYRAIESTEPFKEIAENEQLMNSVSEITDNIIKGRSYGL